jgi:hypothetical protein
MENEPKKEISFDVKVQLLMNSYQSEYQAIANRCTYLISLQTGLLQVPFFYLVIIATAWSNFSQHLTWTIWGSTFILQIIALLWYNLLREQFIMICYLESLLIPRMRKLVGAQEQEDFMGYEDYMRGIRALDWVQNIAEFTMPIIALIILIGFLIVRWQYGEVWWFVGNCLPLGLLFYLASNVRRLRLGFWSYRRTAQQGS